MDPVTLCCRPSLERCLSRTVGEDQLAGAVSALQASAGSSIRWATC